MQKAFWKEIELEIFETVYDPCEDSFLLANTLKVEKGKTFLDMGCGSGIQSVSALHQGAKNALCIDINPKAVKNALHNAKRFGKCGGRVSDLFANVSEKFDVIAFNAPYVESETIEHPITNGGRRGRAILDSFLHEVPTHLNPRGVCYFVQSSLNGEEETKAILKALGLNGEIIAREKVAFEELQAWKVEK